MQETTEHEAAVLLGRRGGSAKSPAKAAASRANGRLGGRPRKPAQESAPEPQRYRVPAPPPPYVIFTPRKEGQ